MFCNCFSKNSQFPEKKGPKEMPAASKILEIPTISVQDREPSIYDEEQIKLLRESCEDVGFFYLRVEDKKLSDLLHEVFKQTKQFFSLPMNDKKRFSDPVLNRGYTAMGEETLDPSRQSKGDTKEGYYLADDIPKADRKYNPEKLSGPNTYPTGIDDQLDCAHWKHTMMDYHKQMKDVSFRLIKMLAMALNLPISYFEQHFEEPLAVLRLLHYTNEVSDVDKGIFACGAHSDYGMLTLLAMDKPGLQIYHDDDWVDVPMVEPYNNEMGTSTFVVNLGDMLERWTNGKFKSTLHRVLISSDANDKRDEGGQTDILSDRYSIPFFYEPSFDTVVECIENCLGDEGAKYPPITSGQHLLDKYKETHADFVESS